MPTDIALESGTRMRWYREITGAQWRVLIAAWGV